MKWILAGVCLTGLAMAEELDLAKYSDNARKLMTVLHQHYPGPIVPTFVKNGAKLSILSFRPTGTDDRLAVYYTDHSIRLQRGADDQIDWNAVADMAHEFWHAYWDQVASRGEKGPDPETFKVFQETRDWLKKQKFDPLGREPVDAAKWGAEAWTELTDEYIGGLVDALTMTYTRLSKDVARGKKTPGLAQTDWDDFLLGKGPSGPFLKNLKTYRNYQENASEYQIRASIADGGPATLARLSQLYGLQFVKK